jgi:hypothetical protein
MRRYVEKKRHELDLLCRAGVGLTHIAPAVCRLVRDMVGAEACALFWLDAQGQPEGFFHEHSPVAAQELFLNEFERLFIGPAEINITTLAQTPGARIGRLLNVPTSYYRSNTFNLLVRASGHVHTLDLRVDVQGRARAVLMLFRAREQPFHDQDAALLGRIEPYLHRALTGTPEASVWSAPASRSGHLLLAEGGRRLLMFAGDAEALLKACTLVGQDVRVSGPMQAVPRFVRDLCVRLHASGQPQAHQHIDIPTGRLSMVAHRLQQAPPQAASDQTLVALELLHPPRLQVVQRVLALGLSPLQREIALLAGVGGLRPDCERVIGVSNEALKKHLKTIYRAAGVAGWDGLAATLQTGGDG